MLEMHSKQKQMARTVILYSLYSLEKNADLLIKSRQLFVYSLAYLMANEENS